MIDDWRVLFDGAASARAQMALDERLADEAVPTVRFFTWSPPAVSVGWKQALPEWFEPSAWHEAGLEWVERPTGGGIALHGSDLSVSVTVPRRLRLPLEGIMRTICESAASVCGELNVEATTVLDSAGEGRIQYCLAETSPYAVMIGPRKVAGFALRRYPEAWLIQGSLLVHPIPMPLVERLPVEVVARLAARACALSEAATRLFSALDLANRWAKQLIAQISKTDFADDVRQKALHAVSA